MQIINDYKAESVDVGFGSVVSLGNFDGVHLGHQALLRRNVEFAHENDLTSVAATFDPHPSVVLNSGKVQHRLLNIEQKLRLFEKLGFDMAVVIPFYHEFAALGPEEFVVSYLLRGLGMHRLVVGYDYALGQGRRGNAEFLRILGMQFDFTLEQVPAVLLDGETVSSSRIKIALGTGKVELAATMLGRPYSLGGIVEEGKKRGRTLGFPTANIRPSPSLASPKNGGYAVWARVGDKGQDLESLRDSSDVTWLPGVCNIGSNPTFGDEYARIETHLFDFSQDIYGCPLEVFFMRRMRDEKKFNSVEELVASITADADSARAMLKTIPTPDGFS